MVPLNNLKVYTNNFKNVFWVLVFSFLCPLEVQAFSPQTTVGITPQTTENSQSENYSPEQLRALHELYKKTTDNEEGFHPSEDAEAEDELSHTKTFNEALGVDISSLEEFASDTEWVSVDTKGYTKGGTYIDVDLGSNYLKLIKNGKLALETPISHGRKGKRTPTGNYSVKWKDANAISAKYSTKKKTAWMRYALFFIGGLYAIHEGDISGQSRGCIRVPRGVASRLFALAPVGTAIRIHY